LSRKIGFFHYLFLDLSLIQQYSVNLDGFVKSPDAALHYSLRHCGVRQVRLIPQVLRALPANLFTKPSMMVNFSTFYKFINL